MRVKIGVFKNGVGRPSNETIKKRNIFKGICVLLVLIIIGLICYILNDKGIVKIDDNKKVMKNNTKKETVNIDVAKKDFTDQLIKFTYSKIKNGFTFISCECSDVIPDEENKIYDSYKENNELHIIFSAIPFFPDDNEVHVL